MGGSGVVERVFAVVAAVVQSCVLQLLVSEHLVRCLHPPVLLSLSPRPRLS